MTDSLHSARVKFARAKLHTTVGHREATRFLQKHPGPTFEVKAKPDQPKVPIGGTIELDIAFTSGFPDLPDSFAARFGDAIQNYRSTLDHLAWQLVKHGSIPNPQEPTKVQFPIYTREHAFKSALATRLPGVSRASGGPCEFIHACHRYKRGKAQNEALLRLADLSNDDKHRSLHMGYAALHNAQHQVRFTQCYPVEFQNPATRPHIQPGAVIAHLKVVVMGPDAEVEVEPTLAGYIALEGWTNAIDVLYELRDEVGAILNAPQILAAVA